ncbi:MAG: hypothetical protein KAX20_03055 [Candidatus Omnitrophica bacterium]|nr:hypothetical protein [Candidatus Omnitrophota bacterium]
MDKKSLSKTAVLIFIVVVIYSVLLISGCVGPSTEIKGTILRHTGEPLAEKEVILIPLLPDDKVTVIEKGNGVFVKYEKRLDNLGKRLFGGLAISVICEADRRGCKWKTKTDNTGSFIIKNVDPGKYVLFQSVAGIQIRMRTDKGWIRINVQEGETNNLGTITLKE